MIRRIYLVRDTAVGAFSNPMLFTSEGAARRNFADEVNRESVENIMNRHPEHFQLYFAGDYDDESGLFKTYPPEFILDATQALTT